MIEERIENIELKMRLLLERLGLEIAYDYEEYRDVLIETKDRNKFRENSIQSPPINSGGVKSGKRRKE